MREKWRLKLKKMPLKKAYTLMFGTLVVVPILSVLFIALIMLNQQFKNQAVENIHQVQETIIAELLSDIDNMSMRISSMVYANNSEILNYAALTDTEDSQVKNTNRRNLSRVENLYLEPEKSIISLYFHMKDGEKTYLKSYINRDAKEIKKKPWYQAALKNKNQVYIGSYDTKGGGDLYIGGGKDILILVFAFAPDHRTDKYEKVEMVELYQASRISDRVKENNHRYENGKNHLGMIQIVNEAGECIYSTSDENTFQQEKGVICIRSEVELPGNTWYIENYVRSGELTASYWKTAAAVLAVAVIVLLLMGYYSRFFLKSIVKPIEEVGTGLRMVEEGHLDVHITARGQYEIRSMIHQFNAMVRRLRSLIEEYEEKVKKAGKNSSWYFGAMLQGTLSPQEAAKEYEELFVEPYVLIGLSVSEPQGQKERPHAAALLQSFGKNLRFTARCYYYAESDNRIYLFYRAGEEEYFYGLGQMVKEIQHNVQQEFGAELFACVSCRLEGKEGFAQAMGVLRDAMKFRYLTKRNAVINLEEKWIQTERVLPMVEQYQSLANALYTADEKNVTAEREKLFEGFSREEPEVIKETVYAVIIAIGMRCDQNNDSLSNIFGSEYDYVEKIERIPDSRGIRMWVTNFFEWILKYSASKLDIGETDIIVKAKRYMRDHFEESDLSLGIVAEQVGLNEKYFSSRFTKEAGETFSDYLAGIRMQKAREYLRTTDFKVYEIAQMVGYQNVEHFNRVFKKENQISPTQYRKAKN